MGLPTLAGLLGIVLLCATHASAGRALLRGSFGLADDLEALRQRLISRTGFNEPQASAGRSLKSVSYTSGAYGYGYYYGYSSYGYSTYGYGYSGYGGGYSGYGGYSGDGGSYGSYSDASAPPPFADPMLRRALLSDASASRELLTEYPIYGGGSGTGYYYGYGYAPSPYGSYSPYGGEYGGYGGYYGYGGYAPSPAFGRRRMLSQIERLSQILEDGTDGFVQAGQASAVNEAVTETRRNLLLAYSSGPGYYSGSGGAYGYGYYGSYGYGGYGGYGGGYAPAY